MYGAFLVQLSHYMHHDHQLASSPACNYAGSVHVTAGPTPWCLTRRWGPPLPRVERESRGAKKKYPRPRAPARVGGDPSQQRDGPRNRRDVAAASRWKND